MDTKLIDVYNNISMLAGLSTKNFKEFFSLVDPELDKLRPKEKTNNILIVQFNAMGDIILSSGFVREVRKNFPTAHITFVYFSRVYDMIEKCPYVDELIPCFSYDTDFKTIFFTGLNFCFQKLWKRQYDIAFSSHFSLTATQACFISWLSGAKERIGFDLYVERFFIPKDFKFGLFIEEDDYNPILTKALIPPDDLYPDVEKRYWLLEQAGLKVTDKRLEIWIDDDDFVEVKSNRRKIVLGIGGSSNVKRYSLRKLIKALVQINQIDDVDFVLIGGKQEEIDAKFLESKDIGLHCINFINKLTLRQTASVISQCDVYIGNDTGVLHMAKVYDLPTLSFIYESTDVEKKVSHYIASSFLRYPPYQANCKNRSIVLRPLHSLPECQSDDMTDLLYLDSCKKDYAHCINQISPEEIVQAYKDLMNL